MLNVVDQVLVVFTILVSCASLEPAYFPGCKNTKPWSSCFPNGKPYNGPYSQTGTCISCSAQLQQQPALNVTNSSQPTSTCLPNDRLVAVRGFSFGILSVQKLRPPQQSTINDLALVQCGITDLEQGILAKFPSLHSLELQFNNLTHIKRNWFDALKFPALFWTLSLSHNRISNMDSKCFQKLTSLVTLLLDSNSLKSIQPSWFHNLKQLACLSLKSNSIEIIPPKAFKSLSKLKHLDLSKNMLTCLSMETVEGLHDLETLSLGGNKLLALDDSVQLVMNWQLNYRHPPYSGQHIAVRVNEVLFCINEVSQLSHVYHVHMQHDTRTQAARPGMEPHGRCRNLNFPLKATSQLKYNLPLIIISVNTESDKHAKNIAHLCKHALEDVSTVKVALGGDTTLQIVPMGIDRSCHPQIVAIILSDVISDKNRTKPHAYGNINNESAFAIEEMTNVTCFVNTWEETYRHVLTMPLSSTPDGTLCAGKTQATRTVSGTLDGTVCTREGVTLTTGEPSIKTTNLTPNQTNPSTIVKKRSPLAMIITMVVVVGVVLVALFVTYVIRRQRCSSCFSKGPPLAIAPLHRWVVSGPDSHAVTVDVSHVTGVQGTATDVATQSTSSADEEHQYEITDEDDYKYYNTRPGAQHPYWEILEDYYSYENTRPLSYPLTLRVTRDDDEDDTITFYGAADEMALPSSTRLGGKHPSYDAAPRLTTIPQIPVRQKKTKIRLYGSLPRIRTDPQIPARQRKTNVSSYDLPVACRYKARDMVVVGKYGSKQGAARSREQDTALYNTAHPACARRQQINVKYQAAHVAEHLKNKHRPNVSYQQAPNVPTIRSKGDILTTYEEGNKARVHRSKTFSMNDIVLKDKLTNMTKHRRQSI